MTVDWRNHWVSSRVMDPLCHSRPGLRSRSFLSSDRITRCCRLYNNFPAIEQAAFTEAERKQIFSDNGIAILATACRRSFSSLSPTRPTSCSATNSKIIQESNAGIGTKTETKSTYLRRAEVDRCRWRKDLQGHCHVKYLKKWLALCLM
jgi:hypothetical protein